MVGSTFSESTWRNWEKSGKAEFFKSVKSLLPSTTASPNSHETCLSLGCGDSLKYHLHDLMWKCVKGILRRDHASQAVGELTMLHPEIGCLIVDVFFLVDAETLLLSSKDERSRFVGLLKDSLKFLSEGTLRERMEIETLGEAGVVKNAKKFFTTVIKMKTKMFYKQQKYNLFREECEGYAKLVTELNQDLSLADPSVVLQAIKSIIGYFNLDPNRVLDVILESFECQTHHHNFFISLLREYTPDAKTLNELLGFKFQFYLQGGSTSMDCAIDVDGEEAVGVPDSLYLQTAVMIQHGIVEMDDVCEILGSEDASLTAEAEAEMLEAKEFVCKMNIVSTKDVQDKEASKAANNSFYHSITDYKTETRQKFRLLEALLEVGAWNQALNLISRLPTYYAVSRPRIAKALCNLIHITVEPLYKKCSELSVRIRRRCYNALENSAAPPRAQTISEFQENVIPMLLVLGPFAADDPVLMFKILRILKFSLRMKSDGGGKDREKVGESVVSVSTCPLYYDILTLMDEVFLPALALSEANCSLSEEIWNLLVEYPYHCRYRLYGLWKLETYNLHASLLKRKAHVQKNAKRIMQRISKENVKHSARQIGKITHSSPGLFFEYVLSQIQLYDNFIGPVVDSLKYLTGLSLDVLGYSIVEALNNPEKDRTKHDGTSISLWLQSLSNFCGAVYKKYNIDLTGVLQYVANQLKSKKSLDLLILKEVVLKMSGIEASEEMTSEQIDAMAGGELLRSEAGSFSQIKNTKKSSQRLKDYLIDYNLAVPLCLLMAQQRNCVVYQETEDSHLKLVGKLFDQCQDTLVQFGNFLAATLSVDDYTRRLPPINELLTKYHVNSDLAFFLARPMFNHQISLKYAEVKNQDKSFKSKSEADRHAKYVETALAVMEPVTEAIRPLHPTKIWGDISPQFLATFWSLTMYDLFVPEKVYDKEIAKLRTVSAKIDDNKELNSARKKKEKERLLSLLERIIEEQKRQRDHVERVTARLRHEKSSWFFSRSAKLAKNETITTFLQLCLFPRCVFTASDAIYCAKFVQIIHSLKTPNFSTLICFDRIFCDITYTVTSCTENEAHRYGRFLAAMLDIVMRWHSAKEIFEKECVGYPGFVTKFRVAQPVSGGSSSDDHVDYENYRHVCHKWHYKIAKALVVCLESKDYVQIRNALTVLTKILPRFPVIVSLAGVIEKRIEKVCADEKEQRKDLYIKATSYSGQLKARKSHMLKENEFHLTKATPGTSGNKVSATTSSNNAEASAAVGKAVAESKSTSKGNVGANAGNIGKKSVSTGKEQQTTTTTTSNDNRNDSFARRSKSKGDERTSRERDASRSSSRERSSSERTKDKKRRSGGGGGGDDENASGDRERLSREREGRQGNSSHSDMGPPQTSNQHRREVVSEDRDTKRRKIDHQENNHDSKERDRKRERGLKSREHRASEEDPAAAASNTKKVDRKRASKDGGDEMMGDSSVRSPVGSTKRERKNGHSSNEGRQPRNSSTNGDQESKSCDVTPEPSSRKSRTSTARKIRNQKF